MVPAEQADVLDGPLSPRPVDLEVVAGNEARLRELRLGLADYADGVAEPDPADHRLLEQVTALRGLLEVAYGQRVTFRGEHRQSTGSPLTPDVPAAVESYVAHVTASGPGAVAVGRDNIGTITTNTYAAPQRPGSAPAGG